MKKFTVLALAALLVVAFTVPASALENIFGGYWRTRMVSQRNFSGDDSGALDLSRVDTRTRLYYTAKINDNLKFVNKFEYNTVWGDSTADPAAGTVTGSVYPHTHALTGVSSNNWGDAGADGAGVTIKNSYADFNVGPVNFLVGIQNFTLLRGFVSDDDAAGMKAIWKVNDGLYLPFVWLKNYEGGSGAGANALDIDSYVFAPVIMLSKDIKISPVYAFLHGRNAMQMPSNNPAFLGRFDNVNVNILGLDFDGKFGAASLWFTGVYQFGTLTTADALLGYKAGTEIDLKAYLVAAGGKFDLGKADIHGQAFYASGDDAVGSLNDKTIDGFFLTRSSTYYWSEILGNGIFDNMSPIATGGPTGGAPKGYGYGSFTGANGGPQVSNMWALNIGTTIKPMDKLSIAADLWYARLAENNVNKDDDLGIEANIVITYKLVEGLNLDIVGAYLFAGDAIGTTSGGNLARNPYEFGTRLSLSF